MLEPSSHSQSYQKNSNQYPDFNSQSEISNKDNSNSFFKRNKDSYLIEGNSEKDESFNKPRFRHTEVVRSKSKSKKKSPFRSKSVKVKK